jgi:hypothetical protein
VLLGLNQLVLADASFSTTTFLMGVKRLGLDAVVDMSCDQRLADGRSIFQARSGESVTLLGLPFMVIFVRYYLRRGGRREVRFVVATFVTTRRVITRHCLGRLGAGRLRAAAPGAIVLLVLAFSSGTAALAARTRAVVSDASAPCLHPSASGVLGQGSSLAMATALHLGLAA